MNNLQAVWVMMTRSENQVILVNVLIISSTSFKNEEGLQLFLKKADTDIYFLTM